MALKAIIRLGDPTSHGGTVIEAFSTFEVFGKPASGIGHKVSCPNCKGVFPIIAGVEKYSYFGKNIAVEGMKTSCGAVLIATQQQAKAEAPIGAVPSNSKKQAAVSSAKATPTLISDSQNVRAEKKVTRIFWSYGQSETPLSDQSRFYPDLNIHLETVNYAAGDAVEIVIKDIDEVASFDGNEIKVSAQVDENGNAKVMNVLKNSSVNILAEA